MEKAKKYLSLGFLALCVVIASFLIYKSIFRKPSVRLPAESETNVSEAIIPTNTAKAVRVEDSPDKLITAAVDISGTKIVPPSLEVVPFTLVTFNNKSDKAIKIVSEKFPDISLASGEKADQLFDRADSYNYTITGLGTSLAGEIIAK